MGQPLRSLLALLTACGAVLAAGCGEGVTTSAGGCDLTTTVGFHGREYTQGGLTRVPDDQVKMGQRIGVGEMAACPGADRDRVPIFKVVGVPVQRAVYVKPYGAMVRSHFDEE